MATDPFLRTEQSNHGVLQSRYGELVLSGLEASSLALSGEIGGVAKLTIFQEAHQLRMPVVKKDPSAAWVGEGEEILQSKPELDEEVISPAKVAGITTISREMARDATPSSIDMVGNGLAREIARKVDEAFFGDLGGHAPRGLESLAIDPIVATELTNLDPFLEARYQVEAAHANVTSWITNPKTALKIAQLKDADNSARVLVEDARQLLGRRLYVSPYVTEDVVWGVDYSFVHAALNQDVELEISSAPYFTSDLVALKATARVGFGYPHQDAIAKVVINGTGTEG